MQVHKWSMAMFGILAMMAGPSGASAASRDTYVLVHGAWMGKSAWNLVARRLHKQGAEVIQVELPAHGKDPTTADKATLDLYVDSVAKAIGDRRGVVLVGHSFGGIVISATAERVPEHIGRLVYVAAYLPRNGESAYSLSQQDKDSHVGQYWTQADPAKYTPVTIRKDGLVDVFCNDCDAKTQQFVIETHREEPVAPMGTPVKLTERFGSIPRFYIATKRDHAVGYSLQQAMIASTSVRAVVTLDSGHLPMLTRPDEVARALRQFASPNEVERLWKNPIS